MKIVRAENYLCFFALLEMILGDINISDFDQFSIADNFDVVFPEGYAKTAKKCRFSDETKQLGAHIDDKVINSFFKSMGLPCSCAYIPYNYICELSFDEMLSEMIKTGVYIIAVYSYGLLNNDSETYETGHAGLVRKIISSDEVELYDPGPKNNGYKTVRISSLFDAIRYRSGGIYTVSLQRK
jgi:hypothetical protein